MQIFIIHGAIPLLSTPVAMVCPVEKGFVK